MMNSHSPRFQWLMLTVICIVGLALVGQLLRNQDQDIENGLGESHDTYARQARFQLIDWHEWGPDAFKKAKSEDKIVLLDLGACWSHDSHEMNRLTYDDADLVDVINRRFVAIKVGIDVHPELYRRYFIQAQLQTSEKASEFKGGLPLIVLLDTNGNLLYSVGSVSKNHLKELLARISEEWNMNREQHEITAQAFSQRASADQLMKPLPGEANYQTLEQLRNQIIAAYDPEEGGFRAADKSKPMRPALLELLIFRYVKMGDIEAGRMVTHTLDTLAQSALYDHLRGGFFNESYDFDWGEPNFEKLLSQNAQMMRVYSLAYSVFKKPLYRDIVYGIQDYLSQNLLDKSSGAFWASQDSDNAKGDDGSFYTWRLSDLAAAVSGDEYRAASLYYDITRNGDYGKLGVNALRVAISYNKLAAKMGVTEDVARQLVRSATQKMRETRDKALKPPSVDKTVFTHLNGIAISALLTAHRVFYDDPLMSNSLRDEAVDAMNAIRLNMVAPDGGLYHMKAYKLSEAEGAGWLDDQVWAARAAIDVFGVTGEPALLLFAKRLMNYAISRYEDTAEGGFYDLADVRSSAGITLCLHKPIKDEPLPAANSIVAGVLDDLSAWTGDVKWIEHSQRTLNAVAGTASLLGLDASSFNRSVLRHLMPPLHVVIIGDPADAKTQAFYDAAARQSPIKTLVVVYSQKNAPSFYNVATLPSAFLCRGNVCLAPITDLARFNAVLADPSQEKSLGIRIPKPTIPPIHKLKVH
ncbi:MAG: DUF255 domain-containing protein [bacterium]